MCGQTRSKAGPSTAFRVSHLVPYFFSYHSDKFGTWLALSIRAMNPTRKEQPMKTNKEVQAAIRARAIWALAQQLGGGK